MASTDARPVPIKNVAYRAYFGIFKNDGTLITSAAGLDSEVSKDGAAFGDCTNEATEISQGVYYLDLTNTEMNADSVTVIVKSSSTDAVPVILSLYPEETGDINVDVTAFGGSALTASGGIPEVKINLPVGPIPSLGIIENGTLQSATASTAVLRSATAFADDLINNAVLEITGGTGAGQVRLVVDWVSATDTATVNPNWTTTPDNTSTYIVRAAPPAPTTSTYVPAVNVLLIEGADPTDTIRDAVVDDATRIDASALNTATGTTIPAILVDTGTTLDGKADAIKAKTDSLTFTTAGMVDSAVKRVGDTTLNAAGTGGQGYGA